MKYYVLSQRADPGCPIGMLNGALYDKYYQDTTSVGVGYFLVCKPVAREGA